MLNDKQPLLLQAIVFFAFVGMTLPYPTIAPLFLVNHHMPIHLFYYLISDKVFTSMVLSAYPFGLFLGGLIIGNLADKYSKKLLLLSSLLLSILCQVLSGVLVLYGAYVWLLLLRLLSGAFEGNIVIARASLAMICNTEQLKLKHFGRMNAALTLGWMLGPLIGGVISYTMPLTSLKYSAPYFLGMCFSTMVFVLVHFYYEAPILLKNNRQREENKKHTSLNKNKIIYLMLASLWITLGIDAFYQFLPTYLSGYFHYDALWVGFIIALVAMFNGFANLVLIPLFLSRFHVKKLLVSFLFILFASLVCLVKNDFYSKIYFILPCVGISIGLVMTNMITLLSSQVSIYSQGKLMGFLLSQRTLGTAFIGMVLTPLLHIGYRLPFVVGAILVLTGMLFISVFA